MYLLPIGKNCHGESEGANFACGFYCALYAPYGSPLFQLGRCALDQCVAICFAAHTVCLFDRFLELIFYF